MEWSPLVDGLMAGIIILSTLFAWSRGFFREFIAILAWVASAIIAVPIAPMVGPILSEIPFVGRFFSYSCEMGIIGGFAVIFGILLIIFSFFTPLLSFIPKTFGFRGLDEFLGLLFGAIRGILLVMLILFIHENISSQEEGYIAQSHSKALFNYSLQWTGGYFDQIIEWIAMRHESLTASCKS